MRLWLIVVVALLAAAGATLNSYDPLPLCPADTFCASDCKSSGGDWKWDDEDCEYRDCMGECDGTAEEDACGVCGGDGSSCADNDSGGCDKDCQTVLIAVGAVILALLLLLFLWFVLSGSAKTFLVPAVPQTTARPLPRRATAARRPGPYPIVGRKHVRRRRPMYH